MLYSEVELGDELPDRTPDVSLPTISRFCTAARMIFSRFMDHEKAKLEGLPGAIVPGIMSQGILAAMIHDWAPGCRIRILDTVFRAPILVDSSPVCRAVVTDTNDDEKCVEVDLTIVNEAGETRVMGTATIELDGGSEGR